MGGVAHGTLEAGNLYCVENWKGEHHDDVLAWHRSRV
jgi:hypothetical protein